MAIHSDFPKSPYEVLDPSVRWFPADETLREVSQEKLLPPLVSDLREKVQQWRSDGYRGASSTSIHLLEWWFQREHLLTTASGDTWSFNYYFAQREAVETVIYLHDVVQMKDKDDLLRFDRVGSLSRNLFDETWKRVVLKLATGSGKTKVMSLILTWSYFHRLYEEGSDLSKNFLVVAPNIIVLDRLLNDFGGLKIFFEDPLIPENGFYGKEWKNDFQVTLHLQDQIGTINPNGNIFLSNVHRLYERKVSEPSLEDDDLQDFFLGGKVNPASASSSGLDLGELVRDVDELLVLNDEAHHVHDPKLSWFKAIQDIHFKLLQKGKSLAFQIDVTATPKHVNGAIFPQTVCDYPLVEAITQNVVKHPVIPDAASRAKMVEKQSSVFTERYEDYLRLGVEEWKNAYDEHLKMGKKAVLFVMTDDTKNCDEVAEYLSSTYPDLNNAVLTIHTKKDGEISESSGGKNDELEFLRKQSNQIDSLSSPYKAIVSVLMLKEGWDVRNVTTIVGLRSYSSKSKILPEQTLGRGLRRMYLRTEVEEEYVSVIGTEPFMDFVEQIQSEGVELERRPMGAGTAPKAPMVIEVDKDNTEKKIDDLNIEIPVLAPKNTREFKDLNELNLSDAVYEVVSYKTYTAEQLREIVFRDITTDEVTHTTELSTETIPDYRSVVGYFTQQILRDLRLFSGYDSLYPSVQEFLATKLFGKSVDLEDPNTLRNLSEPVAVRTILGTFKSMINVLTIKSSGTSEIKDFIRLDTVRPFIVKNQKSVIAKKSVFNQIVGDSDLELRFAKFLDACEDVKSFAKNYFAVQFKIDYVNAKGELSNYYPDFFVKCENGRTYIVETKGLEDVDVPLKMQRLKTWVEDVNSLKRETKFDFVFVDETFFNFFQGEGSCSLSKFEQIVESFKRFK